MDTKIQSLLQEKNNRPLSAKELAVLAAAFRIEMFDVLHDRGTGHWGGASSAAELTTTLYFNRMKVNPKDPHWEDRDRFILSKGHASMNLYTILAHRGFFPVSDLPGFRTLGSHLQGHPSMKKTPGVDMSTGALGHGLSIGLGMSLAARMSGKQYWTYILSGEGCLNEGQTWEAVMMAAKYRPQRMVLMIDYNRVQLDGTSNEIMPLDPLADKFKAFGWNVAPRTFNGHDTQDILESYSWMDADDQWPKAVIYDTTKGRGVSFMEGKSAWHGAPIDEKSYAEGRPQLVADLEKKEALI